MFFGSPLPHDLHDVFSALNAGYWRLSGITYELFYSKWSEIEIVHACFIFLGKLQQKASSHFPQKFVFTLLLRFIQIGILKSALSQLCLWNKCHTQDDWLICWGTNCGHSTAELNVIFSWNCLALNMSMLGKSWAMLLLLKQLQSVIWTHFSNISRSLDHNIALAVDADHSRWVFLFHGFCQCRQV